MTLQKLYLSIIITYKQFKRRQFCWDQLWPSRTWHHPWQSSSSSAFHGRRISGSRSLAHRVPLRVSESSSRRGRARSSRRCCRPARDSNSGRRGWRTRCGRRATAAERRIPRAGSWCRPTCGSPRPLRCRSETVTPGKIDTEI